MILASPAAPIFLNSHVKMDKIVVVGIGNPFRGDDGAGWAVIDALKGRVNAKITLNKIRGDISEVLDYFENDSIVYLIDACKKEAPAGTWQRIDALSDPLLLERAQTSTHGLSISQAISLGKALNQLPIKLIIYAINGDHYSIGNDLSPPVAKAIETVVQSLLKEEDLGHA